MPKENEILSTSPFQYDRQRQKMGVQKKREGDEKTTYTPQTKNRSRDKKPKKKKTTTDIWSVLLRLSLRTLV